MKFKITCLLLLALISNSKTLGQTFEEQTVADLPALKHSQAQWADFNNDGHLDLFITGMDVNEDVYTGILKNNGDNTFTRVGSGLIPLYRASISINDYNLDGLADIIVSGLDESNQKKTALFKNKGSFIFESIDAGFVDAAYGAVVLKDLDKDGLPDVMLNGWDINNTPVFRTYKNTGIGFEEKLTGIPGTALGKVLAIDYNNDGLNDIFLTGINSSNSRITRLYRNDGNFGFTNINFSFERLTSGDAAHADFNNDGFQDIIITGTNASNQKVLKIYINNSGDNSFTDLSHSMDALAPANIALGDFDNDGFADVFLSGSDTANDYVTNLFLNNGDETFSVLATSFPPVINGSVTIGDYNNDQKADLVLFGLTYGSLVGSVYKNSTPGSPDLVPVPDVLDVIIDKTSASLSWEYNDNTISSEAFTYELYLSTSSGGRDIVSPLAKIENGNPQVASQGSFAPLDSLTFYSLPQGVYYWGVQAVDAAFNRSAFSSEQPFTICEDISLGDERQACYGESISLSIGEEGDVVNWYSNKQGLLATNTRNLEFEVNENDTITVELTNSLGCTLYASVNVKVLALPELDLGSNRSLCYNETLTIVLDDEINDITWFSEKHGELATGNTLDLLVIENDKIWAEVVNSHGCTSSRSIEVEVLDLPDFDLGPEQFICLNELLEIDLGVNWASVKWFSEDEGEIHDGPLLSYTILKDEKIWAQVTNQNNCTSVDTLLVTARPLPDFNIGADTALCYDKTLMLNAGEGWAKVEWFSKMHGFIAEAAGLDYKVLEKDTLWAKVENEFGCISFDTIIVDLFPLPNFTVGNDTAVCYGEPIELTAGEGWEKVNWYSKTHGLLAEGQELYTHAVLAKDTLWAEVFNATGCVDYDSLIIDVLPLPDFSIGSDTALCYNEHIVLEAGETEDEVNWYSLNKGLIASSKSLDWQVIEDDTLWAEVINSNGCINYDTISISMYNLPDFTIGADTAICYNGTISLTTGEGWKKVEWFSNVHGYLKEGHELDFTVTEKDTVWANVENENGCFKSDTIVIDVYELPAFSLGADTAVCYQEFITLSAGESEAGDETKWFSANKGLVGLEHTLNWQVLEDDQLWAEVKNLNGCLYYDTISVAMLNLPDFNIGADTSVCYKEPIQLTTGEGWAKVDWFSQVLGHISEGPVLDYTVLEDDVIWAKVENASGCINYDTVHVTMLNLPDFNVGKDTAVCYGQTIEVFAGQGWEQVNWYSANHGLLAENQWFYTYHVLEKDTLWAEVFNEVGCVNYDSIVVDVFELPEFNIGADTSVCYQEHVILTAGDGWDEVNWYSQNQGLIASAFSLDWQVLEDDLVWAEVKNQNGCINYDTISIAMYTLPDFDIGKDTAICFQEHIELTVGTGWQNVNWYSKSDGLIHTGESFNYQVLKTDTLIAEVYNFNNCVNYDTIAIEIHSLPEFTIGEDVRLCYNSKITLKTGTDWELVNWYSGKHGLLASDEWFMEYTVLEDDIVWAEVFNGNGCVNYDTIAVEVLPLPEFSLGLDTTICYKEYIQLEVDNAFTDVKWFSQNKGLIAENTNVLDLQVLGSDKIWAEAKNENGCRNNSDSINIYLEPLPEVDLGGDRSICFKEYFTIEIADVYSEIAWFSSETGLIAENQSSITLTALSDDTIWIEVKNALGCVNYDTIQLQVNPLPQPQFNVDNEIGICYNEPLELSLTHPYAEVNWFSERLGFISDQASINLTALENDLVYVIVTDHKGCVGSDTLTITVNPLPMVSAGEDQHICYGEAVVLGSENEGLFVYEWSPSEGLSSVNTANPLAAPLQTTEYYLKVTDQQGCVNYDTVTVYVNPATTIDAGYSTAICIGESVQLGGAPTASGSGFAYSYEWSPKETLDNPYSPNPVATPSETTTYTLTVGTGDCAVETAEVTIRVDPLPEITISEETTIGFGESVALSSTGGVYYEWTPSDGLNRVDVAEPIASPQKTTTYTVRVTTENGCEGEQSVTVNVKNELFVPNLFTPNGDGKNDRFQIYGSGIVKIIFRVYTKHGNLVYETKNVEDILEKGWDGNFKGRPMEIGSYIWTMDGEYADGSKALFKGKMTGLLQLLR